MCRIVRYNLIYVLILLIYHFHFLSTYLLTRGHIVIFSRIQKAKEAEQRKAELLAELAEQQQHQTEQEAANQELLLAQQQQQQQQQLLQEQQQKRVHYINVLFIKYR